tara:strand:- start:1120 stop:1437 length:318 start_codon:yes stop_codon:yes gene_type:complete
MCLTPNEILLDNNFISIPLVGNKYFEKKPSNKDINIVLVKEKNNKYDPNAIKVVSIREKKYNLGYIIKDKINYINSIYDKISFYTLLKKNSKDKIYYYLIFKFNK